MPFIFFFFFGCYIALVKKFHKPLLENGETKIFKQKRFHKKVVQSRPEKNSGILRLNKIMPRLVTTSKCLQLNCQQIQQLLFLLKFLASRNFIKKETLAQVFSCECCQISQNTFFTKHLRCLLLLLHILVVYVICLCKKTFKLTN